MGWGGGVTEMQSTKDEMNHPLREGAEWKEEEEVGYAPLSL